MGKILFSEIGNSHFFTKFGLFFASETAIFLEYGMESKQGIPSHDYPAATSDLVRCNGKNPDFSKNFKKLKVAV